MFDAPAAPQTSETPPPETRAERRMRRLEQMADQGVEVGRLLTEQARFAAACANTDAVPDNLPHARLLTEIAGAHARVTRAVAIASAIEDRIDQGLPALPELDQARRRREDLVAEKRARAACEIDRGLDGAALSPRRQARLRVDLHRLLDAETADLDRFLARPLPELAARLRRDLGLELTDEDEAWLEGDARENPSPGRGRMGPVAERREDGVTDVAREPTPRLGPSIPSAFETVRAARLKLRPSVTPSSQSPSATGALPSPVRGRIPPAHPPP